jgi:hypothetical protein
MDVCLSQGGRAYLSVIRGGGLFVILIDKEKTTKPVIRASHGNRVRATDVRRYVYAQAVQISS